MSDEYFEDVFDNIDLVGDISAIATAGLQSKTYSQLQSIAARINQAADQAKIEKARQEFLFQLGEEVKRINDIYSRDPAQGLYDTLLLRDEFQASGLSSSEFTDLQWKQFHSEVSNDLESLMAYGNSDIPIEARDNAINAYNETITKRNEIAMLREARKENYYNAKELSNSSQNAFWWAFLGLLIWFIGLISFIRGLCQWPKYEKLKKMLNEKPDHFSVKTVGMIKKGRKYCIAAVSLGLIGVLGGIVLIINLL